MSEFSDSLFIFDQQSAPWLSHRSAGTKHPRGQGHHGTRRGRGHDRLRPKDFEAFVRRMLDPGRDRWQQPARVLRVLRVRPNAVVADIGAGPGYFTLRLAQAVGPRARG